MSKASTRKGKEEKVGGLVCDERKESIHQIRKKIEHILSEREQKKAWEL